MGLGKVCFGKLHLHGLSYKHANIHTLHDVVTCGLCAYTRFLHLVHRYAPPQGRAGSCTLYVQPTCSWAIGGGPSTTVLSPIFLLLSLNTNPTNCAYAVYTTKKESALSSPSETQAYIPQSHPWCEEWSLMVFQQERCLGEGAQDLAHTGHSSKSEINSCPHSSFPRKSQDMGWDSEDKCFSQV